MTSRDLLAEALDTEASAAGLALPAEALARAVAHAAELLAWNAGANLTRLTEPRELARRHFVESFLVAGLLPAVPDRPLRVLDVGAGGGFPGLALRALRPELELVMLEPRRRKAAFLRHVAGLQPPPRPVVETLRLEEYRPTGAFDVITFRAVRLPVKALLRVLAPAGLVVGYPGEEDVSLEADMSAGGLVEAGAVQLPGSVRRIVAWTRRPA